MSGPTLRALPCPSGPAVLDVWWEPLVAALAGDGPALLPVPDGPAGAAVRAAARPGEPLPDDPAGAGPVALVVPTSGSTGEPKPALLPAAALRHSATATLDALGGPGRWLLALPVTHVAGLQVLVRSVLAGAAPVCLPAGGFDPAGFAAGTATLGAGRRYTALVPTQLARLLDAGPAAAAALASYDAVLVGGAACPPALLAAARAAGARVVTTYGMTETCGGCVYDGTPLAGVRVAVGADGRVRLGGPVVFAGYRGRPAAGALVVEDGVRWHVTNDLGAVDRDGRLRLLGRADDVLVTGGEKVAPVAVEAALAAQPGVREAAVLGLPDPEWGQRVVALVVPADPTRPPAAPALLSALADALPRHAVPREVRLAERLPLLGSGKLDREALPAAFASAPPLDADRPPAATATADRR